ncbi:MAG: rRNA maturation RNase YbeY [Patescibacteria group bacterium]|nr:rRNA maturation RNase YbeY [Patescibacteria group bacterium]
MIEINNTTEYKIKNSLIKKTAEKFLQSRRLSNKDLSVAFIGDAKMRALNRKYRKKDCPTDVLSFTGDAPDLGEIIIDPAQIKRQAKASGNSFQAELIFILIHGLLHLVGYDDKTEKERLRMIKIGEQFLLCHSDRSAPRAERRNRFCSERTAFCGKKGIPRPGSG